MKFLLPILKYIQIIEFLFQLQQYKSGNYISNQNETKENGEVDKDSTKNGEINLQQEVADYQAKTHELQTIIEKQVSGAIIYLLFEFEKLRNFLVFQKILSFSFFAFIEKFDSIIIGDCVF